MRALAGVMKYVGIVLISGILILSFCVGLMFFVPKMRLFGYYFRQVDAKELSLGEAELTESFKENISTRNVINLIIEAHDYDVIIEPIALEKIIVTQETDYIGFLKGVKENEGTPHEKTVAQLFPVMKEASLNKSNPDQGKYHWVFEEPQGLLNMRTENSIRIKVPYSTGGQRIFYNLDITTHNGDIYLQNSVDGETGDYQYTLNVNAMSLETNKGNTYFNGVGNSDNESKDGEGKTVAPKVLQLLDLDIKTNGGTFDFRKFDTVVVNNKVVLNSKKAKYLFNTLMSSTKGWDDSNLTGGVVIDGKNVEFRADSVYCGLDGFTYKSETGVLAVNRLISGKIEEIAGNSLSAMGYVNKYVFDGSDSTKADGGKTEFYISAATPYENTIFTDSASITLGTIVGKLGMHNELGDVIIETLCHQASIRTENGDISITRSGVFPDERSKATKQKMSGFSTAYADTSSLILYSTYGNIDVKEYYQDAVVYSKKGKINLTSKYIDKFAKKGKVSYSIESKEGQTDKITISGEERYYYTDVSTKDGQVWVTSDKNPVRVNATDNATINVTIKDVLNDKIELCEYQEYNATTNQKEKKIKYYSLNPFDGYMYEFKTENGTIDATLPLRSYTLKIDCKKISGNIGATEAEDFKAKDTNGKVQDIQISAKNEKQSAILIDGKKAVIRSDI